MHIFASISDHLKNSEIESLAYAKIMAVHFFIIGKLSTIISTAVNVPARRLSKHSIRNLLAIIGKLGSAGNKSYKKKRIMCSRDYCKKNGDGEGID